MKKIVYRRLNGITKLRIPLGVWIVVISTLIGMVVELSIFGRAIVGWAWVIPFGSSIYIILGRLSRISFPIRIWIPWIITILTYFLISGFSYLQRNILLLCPIIVGIAVSTYRVREIQVQDFLKVINLFAFALFITVIIKTGLLFTGVLPQATGLAGQSMTAALLCTVFAARYSIDNNKAHLYLWITGAVIPVIALTRMAITTIGLTLPLTFATLRVKKRIIFLMIIAVLSISLFYTERVQRKMFYSGEGTLQDLSMSNPNFFSTGRSRVWALMTEEIKIKPLWGHGPNASEEFVLSTTWGMLTHPHNDWLRLLYDYGFFGTSIFAFCLVIQVIHLLQRAKRTFGESRVLVYAGASSFLPFVLLMYTDNILLYAAFFGNLQFTILGLAYASQKTREVDSQNYLKMLFANRLINPPPINSVLREGVPKNY